jgi:SAM-dependent MidA family methyltransferase
VSDAESGLSERLRARIRRDGPIRFRDWMAAALYDEREGYYCRRDIERWGRLGDYRTAPERSPLFAATFARYFAKLSGRLGSPGSWTIVEVGAGFGEFAVGILGNLRSKHPDIFSATHYLVDEASEDGRERIAANLTGFERSYELRRLADITQGFPVGIMFSNELIDAFPVDRVIMRNRELRSLYVGLDHGGEFTWIESDLIPEVAGYCDRIGLQLVEGQIAEINLGAEDFIARAAALFERGFVITVDYGAERAELIGSPYRRQGTLRAAYHHQIAGNVLLQPGRRDLTTTIDWTQLIEAGERAGLRVVEFEQLDRFLLREGLLEELESSMRDVGEAESLSLSTGAREMIMPDGMTASFQILVQERSA